MAIGIGDLPRFLDDSRGVVAARPLLLLLSWQQLSLLPTLAAMILDHTQPSIVPMSKYICFHMVSNQPCQNYGTGQEGWFVSHSLIYKDHTSSPNERLANVDGCVVRVCAVTVVSSSVHGASKD